MKPASTNKFKVAGLTDTYNDYFANFKKHAPQQFVNGYTDGTPSPTASSVESITAFLNIIDINGSLLNAGAGASSWMFRHLMKNVTCNDPYRDYLLAVRDVCKIGGLDSNNFESGFDNCAEYDYTYYDYGDSERMPNLEIAFNKTRKMLYADDTDDRDCCKLYRDYIYEFANKKCVEIYDMREAIDKHGRWGVVLVK